MTDVKQRLAETLKVEIGIQGEILERLELQQSILVKCDFEALEENLQGLERLSLRARELNQIQIFQKRELAKLLGWEAEAVTLSDLAGCLQHGEGQDLLVLRDDLLRAARKARCQTRKNMALIRQAMELNQELMRQVFGGVAEQLSTYGNRGERVSDSESRMVDAKI